MQHLFVTDFFLFLDIKISREETNNMQHRYCNSVYTYYCIIENATITMHHDTKHVISGQLLMEPCQRHSLLWLALRRLMEGINKTTKLSMMDGWSMEGIKKNYKTFYDGWRSMEGIKKTTRLSMMDGRYQKG